MKQSLNPKQYLDSILDEQEQTHLINFIENKGMVDAVKKAITAGVYQQGILKRGKPADVINNIALTLVCHGRDISDAEIGADLRALWEGLNYLENAFEAMEQYKVIKPKAENNTNEAI